MYQLFKLIHSYRAFLTFLFIEFICLWVLVRNNAYHSASFFQTSNVVAGRLLDIRHDIVQYINLPDVNERLAMENARLRESLAGQQVPVIVETIPDSIMAIKPIQDYKFLAARVINNSTGLQHNYITINKGRMSGISPGMGVITAQGVVGKVKAVSANFATVSSMMHTEVFVSAAVKRNNTLCTVNWDGISKQSAKLLYLPRHIPIQMGDTILTSGFNAVFPEKLMIGVIQNFELPNNSPFYDIDVLLANDFSQLSYVYIVKNPTRDEQIRLEAQSAVMDE